MPRLKFYDTEAVKEFALDVLVENRELQSDVNYYTRQAVERFKEWQEEKARADALEAQVADLKRQIVDLKGEAYLNEKHLQEGSDEQ